MPTTRLGRFVVTGTDPQIDTVRAALTACTYAVADKLPRDIPVAFADLRPQQALGLFWTDGRIQIEQTLPAARASQVFLAEAWHAIDQYLLTNGDRAALLAAAHDGKGPDGHTWFDNASYYADLGEAAMDVFLAAYSPYQPTGITWEHAVTQRVISALRDILTPVAPPAADLPGPDVDAWAQRTADRVWVAKRDRTAARAYLDWRARR